MAVEEGRGCFGVVLDRWGNFQNRFKVLNLKNSYNKEQSRLFSYGKYRKSSIVSILTFTVA